jgi:amidohydrolase
MLSADTIKSLSQNYYPKILEIRRHLHRHPELSFKEYNTSKFIQQQLSEAGISYTTGHVETGIIALIRGKNPGAKTLLLRADMDALPIDEKNEVAYKSANPGVMHACGHDVHSATMLGAAFILNALKEHWEGTVKIMFQPGEEVLPGGASLMIEAGVLENPKVDKAIALHVFPGMAAGKVGFKSGMYMASTDELYLTVNGKGGHAAIPADYINPLLVASEILLEINNRFMKPGALDATNGKGIPTVVAFGKMEAKGATNVIPASAELAGTFRSMNEAWREEAHRLLQAIVADVSKKYNAGSELRIVKGYPFLVNDIPFTESCFQAAKHYLGTAQAEELPLRMTAEDFAFISQKVPSCFFRLGTGAGTGVHTATFNIDETAMETGMGLVSWLALTELASGR